MKDQSSAITMRDVGAALRAVERLHRVFCEYALIFPTYEGDPTSVVVRLSVVAAGEREQDVIGLAVTARFPTHRHATLIGLLFALAYDMDHVLDEKMSAVAERTALPLWPELG